MPQRTVTAKRPNHVWHVDMTVVPTVIGGFWTMLFPNALPQVWPFCWWLALAEDHFSRRLMGFALFFKQPTSHEACRFLNRVVRTVGEAPKYVVCDRGPQFDCNEFRSWCGRRHGPKGKRHTIKPRYGAVGKYGSLAVIERLVRSVKDECTRRIFVPLRLAAMRKELSTYLTWHNFHRPNMALRGRTPDEVYFKRRPANEKPRHEPRPKYPQEAWCASPQVKVKGRRGVRLELVVRCFEGRRYFPVVEVRPAA